MCVRVSYYAPEAIYPEYTQLISVGRLGITNNGSGSSRRALADDTLSFLATGDLFVRPTTISQDNPVLYNVTNVHSWVILLSSRPLQRGKELVP